MITFTGYTYRSSGIIRGSQVSKHIQKADFINIDNPQPAKNDIVILVRKWNELYAKDCKSKNKIVGFDVSDNPVTDYLTGRVEQDDFSQYVSKFCDFYIVNNDLYKSELEKVTDKKIFVIPHHNCNFQNKSRRGVDKPLRLGYVGMPEYTTNEKQIEDVCKKLGITFTASNPTRHEDLDDTFSNIDIGIVFFEKSSIKDGVYERTIKYKPNTKLTNFQSYGIPTICLPYESYRQFGENQCIFVDDLHQLKLAIENLVEDNEFYRRLSEDSTKVGQRYHISKVVEYYSNIVKETNELRR